MLDRLAVTLSVAFTLTFVGCLTVESAPQECNRRLRCTLAWLIQDLPQLVKEQCDEWRYSVAECEYLYAPAVEADDEPEEI